MLNSTFRFLFSTFCHFAVKLQHQPFTAYKDKSSNTAVPGLLLHCVALFSGHMVGHYFWTSMWWWDVDILYMPTARRSTCRITLKVAVREWCLGWSDVKHWALCILLTWGRQFFGNMTYKSSACFSRGSRTMICNKTDYLKIWASYALKFNLLLIWRELHRLGSDRSVKMSFFYEIGILPAYAPFTSV